MPWPATPISATSSSTKAVRPSPRMRSSSDQSSARSAFPQRVSSLASRSASNSPDQSPLCEEEPSKGGIFSLLRDRAREKYPLKRRTAEAAKSSRPSVQSGGARQRTVPRARSSSVQSAVPKVQSAVPKLRVKIPGEDGHNHGARAPVLSFSAGTATEFVELPTLDVACRQALLYGAFLTPTGTSEAYFRVPGRSSPERPSNRFEAVLEEEPSDTATSAAAAAAAAAAATAAEASLRTKIYVLTSNRLLLEYPRHGHNDRTADRFLQLHSACEVIACDAVQGKPWCLRILVSSKHASKTSQPDAAGFALPKFGISAKSDSDSILLIMESPDELNTWLAAIRHQIQQARETQPSPLHRSPSPINRQFARTRDTHTGAVATTPAPVPEPLLSQVRRKPVASNWRVADSRASAQGANQGPETAEQGFRTRVDPRPTSRRASPDTCEPQGIARTYDRATKHTSGQAAGRQVWPATPDLTSPTSPPAPPGLLENQAAAQLIQQQQHRTQSLDDVSPSSISPTSSSAATLVPHIGCCTSEDFRHPDGHGAAQHRPTHDHPRSDLSGMTRFHFPLSTRSLTAPQPETAAGRQYPLTGLYKKTLPDLPPTPATPATVSTPTPTSSSTSAKPPSATQAPTSATSKKPASSASTTTKPRTDPASGKSNPGAFAPSQFLHRGFRRLSPGVENGPVVLTPPESPENQTNSTSTQTRSRAISDSSVVVKPNTADPGIAVMREEMRGRSARERDATAAIPDGVSGLPNTGMPPYARPAPNHATAQRPGPQAPIMLSAARFNAAADMLRGQQLPPPAVPAALNVDRQRSNSHSPASAGQSKKPAIGLGSIAMAADQALPPSRQIRGSPDPQRRLEERDAGLSQKDRSVSASSNRSLPPVPGAPRSQQDGPARRGHSPQPGDPSSTIPGSLETNRSSPAPRPRKESNAAITAQLRQRLAAIDTSRGMSTNNLLMMAQSPHPAPTSALPALPPQALRRDSPASSRSGSRADANRIPYGPGSRANSLPRIAPLRRSSDSDGRMRVPRPIDNRMRSVTPEPPRARPFGQAPPDGTNIIESTRAKLLNIERVNLAPMDDVAGVAQRRRTRSPSPLTSEDQGRNRSKSPHISQDTENPQDPQNPQNPPPARDGNKTLSLIRETSVRSVSTLMQRAERNNLSEIEQIEEDLNRIDAANKEPSSSKKSTGSPNQAVEPSTKAEATKETKGEPDAGMPEEDVEDGEIPIALGFTMPRELAIQARTLGGEKPKMVNIRPSPQNSARPSRASSVSRPAKKDEEDLGVRPLLVRGATDSVVPVKMELVKSDTLSPPPNPLMGSPNPAPTPTAETGPSNGSIASDVNNVSKPARPSEPSKVVSPSLVTSPAALTPATPLSRSSSPKVQVPVSKFSAQYCEQQQQEARARSWPVTIEQKAEAKEADALRAELVGSEPATASSKLSPNFGSPLISPPPRMQASVTDFSQDDFFMWSMPSVESSTKSHFSPITPKYSPRFTKALARASKESQPPVVVPIDPVVATVDSDEQGVLISPRTYSPNEVIVDKTVEYSDIHLTLGSAFGLKVSTTGDEPAEGAEEEEEKEEKEKKKSKATETLAAAKTSRWSLFGAIEGIQ